MGAVIGSPGSSTGVQMTEPAAKLGIGWAQGTTREAEAAWLLGVLGPLFGEVKERKSGLQWYARGWSVGALGVMVGDSPRSSSSAEGEVYIVVPQGALDPLGWDGQMALLAQLASLGVRLSRLDVYLDDLARLTDPSDVLAAVESGQTRTRVKSWRAVRDHRQGMTTYLGSREGECMVRIYRKWAESGDPTQGTRWEMEAKGARAPLVYELLAATDDPASAYLGLLRAFCDFVERAEGARGDRCALLGWWAALVGSVGRVRLAGRVLVDSLARKLRWFERQCAPTLVLLFARDGSAGLNGLMERAWDRARWDLLPMPVGAATG